MYLAEERMVSLIPRTGGATKVGFPVSSEDISFWKTGSEEALLVVSPMVSRDRI